MSPYFSGVCPEGDTTTAADTWAGNYANSPSTAAGATDTWAGDSDLNATGATDSGYFTLPVYIYPGSIPVCGEPLPVREETEEERQTRLEQQKEAQRRYEEGVKRREEAAKKAEELLEEYIGLEAFGKLHETGYIEVDSHRHKGRKYRISEEHGDFIDVIDENGKVIDSLCVHPAVECPPGDHILARVILLELDEDYILERANSQEPCAGGST